MHAHPYFDLLLHDGDELMTLLGEPIVARETLHEWPLSYVQQITLESGRTLIYKAQFGPTHEPAFYAAARSPLLVPAQTVWQQGAYVCMLLDKAPGRSLHDLPLSEQQVVALGQQLIGQIQRIEGELPTYLDLSGQQQWFDYVQSVIEKLHRLIASSHFNQTTLAAVAHLRKATLAPSVMEALFTNTGYVHGDLTAQNIVVQTADDAPLTVHVLDWQRPLRGPCALDLYTLLDSLGYAARSYVAPGLLIGASVLRIGWLVECAAHWFQPGAAGYDGQIAQIIEQI